MSIAATTRMPVSYVLVRWLFKFVLKLFYGTIVIENSSYLPKKGEAWLVTPKVKKMNLKVIQYIMPKSWKLLNRYISFGGFLKVSNLAASEQEYIRLTAKSTLFGKRTFSSWLIEKSGALPIRRRIDNPEARNVDNTEVMEKLYEALRQGHIVCLFPEGMSRYRSALSPLKTGVARILSEVLTRNQNNPNFQITLLTCSITYMHRQNFRSDVLVRFNTPMKFKPKEYPSLLAPVDFRSIKSLTELMANQLSVGSLDAPSWEILHTAKVASRIYAPLGTRMTLGDYVRVTRIFVEGFMKTGKRWSNDCDHDPPADVTDAMLRKDSVMADSVQDDDMGKHNVQEAEVDHLAQDLRVYHSRLVKLGIRDERIRFGPLPRRIILSRIVTRATWLGVLSLVSLPGFLLWSPVFTVTKAFSSKYARRGDPEDVWDEIAQNKLLAGLFTGLAVWFTCVLCTLPVAPFTFFIVPCLMWISLRWLEDTVSAFRALAALTSLLWIGKPTLLQLATWREEIHSRVMKLALDGLGLPDEPEKYFQKRGGHQKGRIMGSMHSTTAYFSLRRRRKKSWDEILRIWPREE